MSSFPEPVPLSARRVAGAAASLALLGLAGKGVGLLRELVIARSYGAGPELDAYLVAFTLPDIISTVAMYVALNLFLPVYLAERERSPEGADRLASVFWSRTWWCLVAVSILLVLLAPMVIAAIAPGLRGPLLHTAVASLRLLAFVILFRGMEGLLRGLLNAHRRFLLPTFGSILVSFVVIPFVIFGSGRLGVRALTWGVTLGALVPVALVLPAAVRSVPGLLRAGWGRHPGMREVTRLLPWFLAIEAASLILPLVDRAVAARFLEPGRISALSYARILYEVPFNLVGMTLAITLFPEFATLFATGDLERFQAVFRRGVRAVTGVILPAAVLLVVLRTPVTRAIYERGAFGPGATGLTASALWAYALGLPFLSAAILASQAAFAARMLPRVLGAKIAALAVKLVVSLALLHWLGHAGIALGTSAFFVVMAVLLVPHLAGGWRGLVPHPGILAAALAVSGAGGWGLARLQEAAGIERGAAALAAQAVVWLVSGFLYLGVCRLGKVEEVLWLEKALLRRLLGRGGVS